MIDHDARSSTTPPHRRLLSLALLALATALLACRPDAAPRVEAPPAARPAADDARPSVAMEGNALRLVFLGDSLTAGYGLSEEEAYPALIEARLKERGWPVRVVNAGVSGDTSAGGLRRIDWLLEEPIDVLVLALGANDGLRGFSVDDTRANLQRIVDKTLAADPNTVIVVVGMLMPPNLGPDYTEAFRETFPGLAEKNKLTLIPFLLEGVAGDPELNQADGIHPTAQGQRIVAETVWQTLEPILEARLAQRGSS